MMLSLSFDPPLERGKLSRIFFEVGEAAVRSYPMLPDDHYRDMLAIQHFLRNEQLSSLFLGDEPRADILFTDGGAEVVITPYTSFQEKATSAAFNREQGLNQLQEVLEKVENLVSTSPEALRSQVQSDIEAGVFNVYLRKK